MSEALPKIYLVRHGETAWSLSHQHTGRTDIPLTAHGEEEAKGLRNRLEKIDPVLVLSSPSQRARRTGELAGWGERIEIDTDLYEWDYGDYEGRKTADIQRERPNWTLFRDGCPNGESTEEVGSRADHLIARIRAAKGNVLLFGHGHMLRVLAARWLDLSAQSGALFALDPASVSLLSYEHTVAEPVLSLWNEI